MLDPAPSMKSFAQPNRVAACLCPRWRGLVVFASLLPATALALPPFPSLTQPIREEITVVEQELADLPVTPLSISPWTHGFSSRQHETPEQPVQIDISFPEAATVDLVVLMPATYTAGDEEVRAFGFPVRFKIERVLEDGSTTMLADHLNVDYPTPGLEPQLFPCDDTEATAGIRITVTELPFNPTWWRATKAVAFSELFAFAGERNVALRAEVTASNSFDFSYIWSPSCLTDGFFPFSPINFKLSDPEDNFALGLDEVVLGFDLGKTRRVDEFRLWPVVHSIQHYFPNSSGVGFPTHIRVEVGSNENFEGGTLAHESPSIRPRPGSDPLMLRTTPTTGRYIRLTLANGRPDFRRHEPKRIALSEIEFLEAGRVVPIATPPRLLKPDRTVDSLETLTDGSNSVGRIMPLREWITKFQRRKQLEKRLHTLGLDLDLAQRNEERRNAWILIAAVALILLLLQLVWLVRSSARRRWERMREQMEAAPQGAGNYDRLIELFYDPAAD